jgi:tetratricopeptide (TPR) repeat protein
MNQTCPSCERPVSGRFCSHCGVAVDADCAACGNKLPAGARFCNQCGVPAGATLAAVPAARPEVSRLPWLIAGAAVAALAAVLFFSARGEDDPRPGATAPLAASGSATGGPATPPPGSAGAAAAPGGNPGAVDLSSMTPREAADRLFNRVMEAVSRGDTTQARFFIPMAIQAYGRVPELDNDGHYHLAVLHLVNGDGQSARAEANAILSRDPSHLYGLFTAAQAEESMGNRARARELYQRFLDAYDTEIARGLPEYAEHRQAIPGMRGAAERGVGTGG